MNDEDDDKPTELQQLQLRVRQLEQLCDDLEEAGACRAERERGNLLLFAGFVIGVALAMHLTSGAA
jgi:hypothetical protein